MIKKLFLITVLFFSSNGWSQVSVISCELSGTSKYQELFNIDEQTTPLKINIEISMEKDFDGEERASRTILRPDGVRSPLWTDKTEFEIGFTDENISLSYYIPRGPHPNNKTFKINVFKINITLNRYTGKAYLNGDIQGNVEVTGSGGGSLYITEFLNATGNCSTAKERKF